MQKEVTFPEANAMKYPEQIVIAIAKDPAGKCNPISLGWTMISSGSPPMMAISVGKTRYSLGGSGRPGSSSSPFPPNTRETR